MRDLHNNISPVVAVVPVTLVNSGSPENQVSGDVDLQNFEAAEVSVMLGDIDELGGSPVGAAAVTVQLEHAADDGNDAADTYADVADADVIGAFTAADGTADVDLTVTGGIVISTTDDARILRVGYKGGKRFLRVTIIPAALTNGGPVAAWVDRGVGRHNPEGAVAV